MGTRSALSTLREAATAWNPGGCRERAKTACLFCVPNVAKESGCSKRSMRELGCL